MNRYFWVTTLTFVFANVSFTACAFDCAKAYLPVDFVICSDPAVIRANEAHEKAWHDTRARLTDAEKQELLADQRRWLKEYPPRCGVPAKGKQLPTISRDQQLCVERALEERRAFLEQYPNGATEAQSSPETTARAPQNQTAENPAVLPVQGPGPFSRIEQVDFFNFTYPTGPNDCSNPPPDRRKTVTLKGGKFIKIFRDKDSTFELKYEMDKKDIAFGDITGSPSGETVIALRCGFMTNFWTTTIYVYTLRNGMPSLLAKFPDPADYGVISLSVDNRKAIIEGLVDPPHACPENIARFVYKWNGRSFALTGKPVKRKNPDC